MSGRRSTNPGAMFEHSHLEQNSGAYHPPQREMETQYDRHFERHEHSSLSRPYIRHEHRPFIDTNLPPPPLPPRNNQQGNMQPPYGDSSFRYGPNPVGNYNTPDMPHSTVHHSQYAPSASTVDQGYLPVRNNYGRPPPAGIGHGMGFHEAANSDISSADKEYVDKRAGFNDPTHFDPNRMSSPWSQNSFHSHVQQRNIETFEDENRPHPSHGLSESLVGQASETSGNKDKKVDAQELVNKWLTEKKINHRLKKSDHQKSSIGVPEAKRLFREAMQISEYLQISHSELKNLMNDPGEAWQDLLSNVKKQKARLEEIKLLLDGPTVKALSLKQLKIQAKRERLKKNSMKTYNEKREKRDRLHREIDERLSLVWKKDQELKKERELKKAADETLAEVRRKLNEAQKAVDLMGALTKLRQLRKEATERKGLYVPKTIESTFGDKTKALSAMLEEQLKVYEAEKKTLEALLEQEAEESREREILEKRKQIQELEKRKERTIRRLLFGREVMLDEEDPLLPFRQYYQASDLSLEAFIQIRREWDIHLVPPSTGGSRIPEGWVLPAEPSSNVWASALKGKT